MLFRSDWDDDSAVAIAGLGRFRVNVFAQARGWSSVWRCIPEQIPSLQDLNTPACLTQWLQHPNGLLLVTGATGSGKSTTLAALLAHLNHTQPLHILTLEDPIEFVHPSQRSLVQQRKVPGHSADFATALRAALRQDPDVILVGEMRDAATFETALAAAETGHLVFGTLHSSNAQQAVQRLFEFFDPAEAANRRRQVASTLQATITQKLVPAVKGGRVPAVEVFRMDVLGRRVIEQGEFEKIGSVIEAGKEIGSRSFNSDLFRLIQAGAITKETGLEYSPNPKALEMNLKGIFLSQGGIVG